MDLPYPVGNETNVSFPDANDTRASICCSFNDGTPRVSATATAASVISLIRCRLSFSLLRSAIMCLRGSRSTAGHPLKEFDFVLAGTEGRLPLTD